MRRAMSCAGDVDLVDLSSTAPARCGRALVTMVQHCRDDEVRRYRAHRPSAWAVMVAAWRYCGERAARGKPCPRIRSSDWGRRRRRRTATGDDRRGDRRIGREHTEVIARPPTAVYEYARGIGTWLQPCGGPSARSRRLALAPAAIVRGVPVSTDWGCWRASDRGRAGEPWRSRARTSH